MSDIERSTERFRKTEGQRAKATGFGSTQQGQALARRFREHLATVIAFTRENTSRRDRPVWRHLKDLADETVADQLLFLGISAAESDSTIGTNKRGRKSFRS